MIYIQNNGNVYINRGDTFDLPLLLRLNDYTNPSDTLTFEDGDELTLYITEPNLPNTKAVIEKSLIITTDNIDDDKVFSFTHSDTSQLCPKTYSYEVQLKRPNKANDGKEDSYITIIPRRIFSINL